MKIRIEDIAKMANVSKASVSLALNNKPGISEETRQKILDIAKETGYTPRTSSEGEQYLASEAARMINFVACVNTGIVNEQYQNLPFFMELISYIQEYLPQHYSLMFSSVKSESFHEEINNVITNKPADGVILLGTNLAPREIELIAAKQPNLVVIDTCYETLNVDFVDMNNFYGAYQAVQYLIKLGHKKIGYVQSDSRMYNFEMRKKGALAVLDEHSLSLDEKYVFHLSPTVFTAQESFKQEILKLQNNLPTALFCECDYMAISVIKALNELGVKVPQDISIIGFDDIPQAQIVSPELTTIRVNKEQMAALAVKKLMEIIEEQVTYKSKVLIDTELIERRSCTAIHDQANLNKVKMKMA